MRRNRGRRKRFQNPVAAGVRRPKSAGIHGERTFVVTVLKEVRKLGLFFGRHDVLSCKPIL